MVWIPPDSVTVERERIAARIRAGRVQARPSPRPIIASSSRDDQTFFEGYTLPGTAQTLCEAAEAAGWGVVTTWATAILPPGFQRTDRSKPLRQAVIIDSFAVRLTAVRQTAWAVWVNGTSDPPVAGISGPGTGIRSIGVQALIAYIKGDF